MHRPMASQVEEEKIAEYKTMPSQMMTMTPSMWAGCSLVLGLVVVITGLMSKPKQDGNTTNCKMSPYTYVNVVIGAIMAVIGGMVLAKKHMGKTSLAAPPVTQAM